MLISLRHKFLFVANLRTASTSIEGQLRRFAEVCITMTRFGKHLPLARIEERFGWVYDYIPRAEMFVWGVMRDPVDYVVSIYRFHQKEAFAGKPNYTGDLTFAEFWERWTTAPGLRRQLEPQSRRFLRSDRTFGADHIVDLRRLPEEWPALCERLGVPVTPLRHVNASPETAARPAIPDRIVAEIRQRYAEDYERLEQATTERRVAAL